MFVFAVLVVSLAPAPSPRLQADIIFNKAPQTNPVDVCELQLHKDTQITTVTEDMARTGVVVPGVSLRETESHTSLVKAPSHHNVLVDVL